MLARALLPALRGLSGAPGASAGAVTPALSSVLPAALRRDGPSSSRSAAAQHDRGALGVGTSPLHALVARRWKHIIQAPGTPYKIYHPSVTEPEGKVILNGSLDGPARYIPRNFRHQKYIESIRSGEYRGPDYPYQYLGRNFWQERRYNVTYNPIPADMSSATGVVFHARLNIWGVEWWEQGKQRMRWFRAQYGFERAKQSAETFRKNLVEAGRVDNRRTEREVKQQQLQVYASRALFKKKFSKKDARRLGNSGTRMGPEWKVRKDYKARGLLP